MRKYFSEFFPLTEVETKALWSEAVFIFDTNILLNLYQMSQETSSQIKGILQKLKGRLFLPHQVGVEFFKLREEKIAEQVRAFEKVRKFLDDIPDTFKGQYSRHPCIPIIEITEALRKCVDIQIAIVKRSQEANQLNYLIHDDPILQMLDSLFTDSSGEPYTGEVEKTLNEQVEERMKSNLPPCFVPTGKKEAAPLTNNRHHGDGRIWFQIVHYAEKIKKPIIFVTADGKPNWWRTAKLGNKDSPIGPHFQLVKDVESVSENRFLMYTQEEFLLGASKYLDVPEQTKAIEEVKQIREIGSAGKDIELTDERTCFYEEPKSLGEPIRGLKSGSEKKDTGLEDQPKISALHEAKSEQKSESPKEVD